MRTRFFPIAAAVALSLAACSDDDNPDPADTAIDAADVGADAAPDLGSDVTSDIGDDSGSDAEPDTSPDTGTDTDTDLDAGAPGTCAAPLLLGDAQRNEDGTWTGAGDTAGAAADLDGTCSDEPGPENVWSWTAPEAGVVTVHLTGPDAVLHVRASCDDIGTEVACNDDASDDTLDSRVLFATGAGEAWTIVADTYDAEEVGPYTLTVALDTEGELPSIEDGLYESRGYGYALDVDAGQYALLQQSADNCMVQQSGAVLDLALELEWVETTETGLRVLVSGSIAPLTFDTVDTFTGACADGLTPSLGDGDYERDALVVFDTLVQAFDEHYAFFELREVDWAAAAATARATLTAESDDDALHDALVSLLAPLEDGHVSLTAGDRYFESKPLLAERLLAEEFESSGGEGALEDYVNQELIRWYGAIGAACDGDLRGEPGDLTWCRLDDTTGYVNTLHFGFEGGTSAAAAAIDAALGDLAGVQDIIFDIRVNGGGSDTHSLEIASRFAAERTLAFSKAAVDGDGFTESFDVYVEAGDAPFTGRVALLVSGSSVSAAEIFTMAMRELPNVTVYGHRTSGELSDILPWLLPNGWSFGLSNEVYTAADGEVYEMVGIPPDVLWDDAELIPVSDREEGTDSWIALALDALATPEE